MGTGEPRFVRRQLGVRLQRLREEARKSQEDVATTGIASRHTLWRMETGQTASSWMKVEALCRFYGADEPTTQAMVRFSKASSGKSWLEAYDDVVPQALQLYLGCELAACEISIYNPELVPGALQTPEYARAIFAGEGETAASINRLVEARLERQERFWTKRPVGAVLCAVINEAALARHVGGRATMTRQLHYMREAGERDGVEVRVLGWAAGAHPAIYGGYTIFDFPDREDPTVVYAQNYTGGQYLQEEPFVAQMRAMQETVYHLASPIKEYA